MGESKRPQKPVKVRFRKWERRESAPRRKVRNAGTKREQRENAIQPCLAAIMKTHFVGLKIKLKTKVLDQNSI